MILQQLELLYKELQSGEFLAANVWQNEDGECTPKDALKAARHTLKRAANMRLSEGKKQMAEYCEAALETVAEQVSEAEEKAAEAFHYWKYRNAE